MNGLLGSLVVLATLVTLCNAQCYFMPNTISLEEELNGCRDLDGVTYALDSKWKADHCLECSCDEKGINCCMNSAKPVNYDEEKCQKFFDVETCTYKVVERENPEKDCSVEEWVM